MIAVHINTNGNACSEVESLNQFNCALVAAISGFPNRGNYSCYNVVQTVSQFIVVLTYCLLLTSTYCIDLTAWHVWV
jgi:hypothetical protein